MIDTICPICQGHGYAADAYTADTYIVGACVGSFVCSLCGGIGRVPVEPLAYDEPITVTGFPFDGQGEKQGDSY